MSDELDAITRMVADMSGRDPADITPNTRLTEDLGIKSANRMEIVARLEDEIGVQLSVSDVLRAKTIDDLVERTRALSSG